jgi:hypothetical protein
MSNYSGLWDGVFGEQHQLINGLGNTERTLNRVFSGRNYDRLKVKELLLTLIGAAPGDTASATFTRVAARRDLNSNIQGGVVPMETVTVINRATTSADVTKLIGALNDTARPATYARDLSGNGGGGKLGY